jgi:A/G-specific adenine glycosylase
MFPVVPPFDSPAAAASMRRALLAWYRRHARTLPWRATRDPYRVWVSEAMLQQTRVATAAPYYVRFLERFPTLDALAAAPRDRVLEAWAGLGYYRRARHLHEAARTVVRDHGGRLPDDPGAFAALPGVGRYTVGAVLSIAFDRPLPVLDGNVARVLARLTARPWSARDRAGAQHLWALATRLVPMRRPGEWNQALMELGARVCTPQRPRCGECPIARGCRGRASGAPADFPPVTPRRAARRIRRAVALVERDGRWLLTRRTGTLLGGLWEPPGVDVPEGEPAAAALVALLRGMGVRAKLRPAGRTVRHVLSHRVIEADPWLGRATVRGPARKGVRWADPASPGVGLSAFARRLLAVARGAGPRRGHVPAARTARG